MPNLGDMSQPVVDLVRELGSFIARRVYRKTAGDAGELSFFRTGMLASLKKIAEGNGESSDQERLQRELIATEAGVTEVINRLRAARDKLVGQAGGAEFAHRIDDLLYGPFGKGNIRAQISEITKMELSDQYLRSTAQSVCNDIEAFNRAVIELGKRAADRGE